MQLFVQKYSIASPTRILLQRQGDEITKPPPGGVVKLPEGVLIVPSPIVLENRLYIISLIARAQHPARIGSNEQAYSQLRKLVKPLL